MLYPITFPIIIIIIIFFIIIISSYCSSISTL